MNAGYMLVEAMSLLIGHSIVFGRAKVVSTHIGYTNLAPGLSVQFCPVLDMIFVHMRLHDHIFTLVVLSGYEPSLLRTFLHLSSLSLTTLQFLPTISAGPVFDSNPVPKQPFSA